MRLVACSVLGLLCVGLPTSVWAIPPNTPITNTAVADYQVAGSDFQVASSNTVVTDANSGNSAPSSALLDPAELDENLSGVVGTLTALDLDPGDSHTFTTTDPRFLIVGDQLQTIAGLSFDFETEASVLIDILVTDSAGASSLITLSLDINDVNEAPAMLALSNTTLVANVPGSLVGDLSVTDPDIADVHSYTVDDARFEIVGTTLKLIDTESLVLGSQVDVLITVTDSGGLSVSQSFSLLTTPPGGGAGGNAIARFLLAADGAPTATPVDVPVAQCDGGSGFQDVAPPSTFAGELLILPGTLELAATAMYKSGDSLFFEVTDADANLDPALVDSVNVDVVTSEGDSERLQLRETAADSGRFVGYLQSVQGMPVAADCVISAGVGVDLSLSYTDAADASDLAVARSVINPLSRVFLASTGQAIDGATITLINAGSGNPAAVSGESFGSVFPATLTSGGSVVDDQAQPYNFPAGSYRFPAVSADNYQLQVTPPNRFRFPTLAADLDIQTLPGAPYNLGTGARGGVFVVPVSGAFSVEIPLDLAPIVPTASTLELLALAPVGGVIETVSQSQCFDGSDFVNSPAPVVVSGSLLVPGPQPLSEANRFNRGDVIFLRLRDADQDLDPFAADLVLVSIAVAGSAEREEIRLQETGLSTGVFTGYLQTNLATPVAQDCALSASAGSAFTVSYQDQTNAADNQVLTALLDPGFTTFDSADGSLIDGVEVTLIDVNTGLSADGAVFAEDGVTVFPATLVSGGTVVDGAGNSTSFASGSFRFPVVTPGTYQLQITPPQSYRFPSQVADSELNQLASGPYQLEAGSRGATFDVVAGANFEFDIPLDALAFEVFVSKQASKDTAAIGDVLQYQVLVQNPSGSALSDVSVHDLLPGGFRYLSGSSQIDGIPVVDPVIDDTGRGLAFGGLDIGAESAVEVKYVVEVGVGARLGRARNEATASAAAISSANVAFADVIVREDLLQSKGILLGQVFDGACSETQRSGLADVRVWLEDGTYVVTDAEGKYHIEGIEPGTHVVQVDPSTLPETHELIACEQNTRFAGSSHSQFVDLQAGSMWRADFYTRLKPAREDAIRAQLSARAVDTAVYHRLDIAGGEVAVDSMTATFMLDPAAIYRPGSLLLNGVTMADPTGAADGTLTVRLGDQSAGFEADVRFVTDVEAGVERLTTKGIVMFATPDQGRQKTPVLITDLEFKWPDSLSELGPRKLDDLLSGQDRDVSANAYEPSRGELLAKSNLARVEVSRAPLALQTVARVPEVDDGKAPEFDRAWLAQQSVGNQLVWPLPGYNPRIPVIAVVAKHVAGFKAEVLINGELVNPLTYAGTTIDRARGLALSRWDNVSITDGDNRIEIRLVANDPGLKVAPSDRVAMRTTVHFGAAPVRAEFVPELSHLVADGMNPPVIAVRFFDRAGYPARPGMTGEFAITSAHELLKARNQIEGMTRTKQQGFQRYLVRQDGVAFIELEPTTVTGEVRMQFEFDELRGDIVRVRLTPGARDWILVGLVEGVLGYNDVGGSMDAADEANLDDGTLTDGRMAFYVKGTVKGDWLLTAAYDTDKETQHRLRQEIDPNRFYTLYGDGAEQRYDAESASKLYLKVERDAFAGLYGDFDTGLDESELSKYTRTLTGAQASYFGERYEMQAFASDTEFAFIFDELRGDGTSGTYYLSRKRLIINSERVRIVTRDRFHPEQIVEEVSLSRYIDYTIDYAQGSLIFKQPVMSQDQNFNKTFIEVEYEIKGGEDKNLIAGGRLAYRLDAQDSKLALTYIDDQTQGQGGRLTGADLFMRVGRDTTVRAEIAHSNTDVAGKSDAYLLEVEHQTGELAGRAYFREEDAGFGLGQLTRLGSDTRKYGVEGEYRMTERVRLLAEIFRQDDLATNGHRVVADSQAEYQLGDSRLTGGLRSVREVVAAGESRDSDLLTLGVGHSLLDSRLLLRGNAELAVSKDDNTDYPTRVIVGGDYALNGHISLMAEQEFTYGKFRNTQDTRIGVIARPWNGADISTTLQREMGENGERLFATTGLLQQLSFKEHWLADFGIDRVQTIKQSIEADEPDELLANPSVPVASGSINTDFTAAFMGLGYRKEAWDVSSRLEFHHGDRLDKWNVLLGMSHQLSDGAVTSGSMSALWEKGGDGSIRNRTDLRWGLALRPFDSAWTLLNRTDLVFDETRNATFDTRARKLVNNTNLNFKPRLGGQLSLQLGFKYLVETIDHRHYDAITALYGAEYRRDFNSRWDWGVHAAALQSIKSKQLRYSTGLSVGHSVFDNTWVSLGYNFTGFDDNDFTGAEYTAQGPYLKLRMKLDQTDLDRFIGFVGRSD